MRNERIRLLIIMGQFGLGGAEVLVKTLVHELDKDLFDVRVLTLSHYTKQGIAVPEMSAIEQEFRYELEAAGASTGILGKPYRKGRLITPIRLRKQIRQFSPDIIHCHLENPTLMTVIATMGLRIPIVHTIHNTVLYYPLLYRNKLVRKRIAAYVAISSKVFDTGVANGVERSKLHLILNGIDLSKFMQRGTIPAELENENTYKMICIGRFVEQKDHRTLLEALKGLEGNWRLFLVGTGPLEQEMRRVVDECNLNDHVRFLGLRQDVRDLLGWADLYIMSSKYEGLSISLIEAAASGIPIVATDVGSNSEILQQGVNGLLVPPSDPVGLRKAIEEVMGGGVHFRRTNMDKFSSGHMTKEYQNLYEKIAVSK